jgi:RNA recognition motif-containing protein
VCEAKSRQQRQKEIELSTFRFKKSMQFFNLIVRNVDPCATKEEFDLFFSKFGEIRSSKIVPDAGIGFVCFKDRESAKMVKETPDLIMNNCRMEASYCEPKESRLKRQEE